MIKKRQQRYLHLLHILRRRRKQTLYLYFTQATEPGISVTMMPFLRRADGQELFFVLFSCRPPRLR